MFFSWGCKFFAKKMNKEKLLQKKTNVRQLALGMMAYTSTSIIGPLIFFGFVGFFLDKFLNTKPLFLILGVLVAFITTNILILKKVNKLSKAFEEEEDKKNNDI